MPSLGARVVVVPADRILVGPRQRQLQVVAGHALVHDDRPRIAGRREIEVGQRRRRHADVADAVLLQAGGAGEVVGDAQERQRRQIGGQRQVPVVLHPRRHGQQLLALEKRADGLLVDARGDDLRRLIGEERQRRQRPVAALLERFERHRALPLLPAHGQELVGSEGHQRHLAQEARRRPRGRRRCRSRAAGAASRATCGSRPGPAAAAVAGASKRPRCDGTAASRAVATVASRWSMSRSVSMASRANGARASSRLARACSTVRARMREAGDDQLGARGAHRRRRQQHVEDRAERLLDVEGRIARHAGGAVELPVERAPAPTRSGDGPPDARPASRQGRGRGSGARSPSRAARRAAIDAGDQSGSQPTGRSMRGMSSPVDGWVSARHFQNACESSSSGSAADGEATAKTARQSHAARERRKRIRGVYDGCRGGSIV